MNTVPPPHRLHGVTCLPVVVAAVALLLAGCISMAPPAL